MKIKLENNMFWKNKKIFITGGQGFVGNHLVDRLSKLGAKVIEFNEDVRLFSKVLENIRKSKPDLIYHLAAQSLIEEGKDSPLETFEVNIMGTWNILEAARIVKIKKIIIASTTHVYGDNPNLPYKEEYYPQPSRPYETSKASADLLAQCYADTYDLQVEISRMVNLYGPKDVNTSRIVPNIILSLMKGINPKMFDVGAVRDFLYIDDAVDGFIKLGQTKMSNVKRTRVINFGTGKPIAVLELVKTIIKEFGDKKLKLILKSVPENRQKEIQKQYVSIEKAEKILGWYPKTSLDDGIKKTIDWYKQNI